MTLDPRKLFKAYDPTKTLAIENAEDKAYYIDFSSVRGNRIIEDFEQTITYWYPDEPTCQLFTGHIGCGKSTELLGLKATLENQGFHVVYFEANQLMDLFDVDVTEIMLAIACQVYESLKKVGINLKESFFSNLLKRSKSFLGTEIESVEVGLPGIASLNAKLKDNPELRKHLRQYLEPQSKIILEEINREIITEGNQRLKSEGKRSLVVVVDSLDRVGKRTLANGRTQLEYLFIQRGEELCQLQCHLVYIVSLDLILSDELNQLNERFTGPLKVLPMIPVKKRDGTDHIEGMNLLRQMVLARAFPEVAAGERLELIPELFDSSETLDRLCQVSGGQLRGVIRLTQASIQKQRELPISRDALETVIKETCNYMAVGLKDEQFDLLRQVMMSKKVFGEQLYRNLVRNLLIFGYIDEEGYWFDVNPILAEAKELKL